MRKLFIVLAFVAVFFVGAMASNSVLNDNKNNHSNYLYAKPKPVPHKVTFDVIIGDCNNDGLVDIGDITQMIAELRYQKALDFNEDGVFDTDDYDALDGYLYH